MHQPTIHGFTQRHPRSCSYTQVHAVSTSQPFQSSMLRPDVAARLQAQMSVNVTELAAAKWMFGLLDFDNDGECKSEGVR